MMVTGPVVFAGSSLAGGLAHSSSLLIGARLAQGVGAAMLSPAALSTLTSTFRSTRDRNTALGVWAAVSGIGGAAGVLFGGLLTQGPGWRWVLFINVPFSAIALVGAFALLNGEPTRRRLANFDALGALLATGGMLLLVYALVKAPDVGWGTTRTIATLAGAAVILAGPSSSTSCGSPTRSFRSRSCGSRESPPPTPRRWWPSPASCRCSSSSPSTCRPCSATRRSRRAPPTCR